MMMIKVRHKLILILGIAIIWMSYWIIQITSSSSTSSTTSSYYYEIPSLTSTSFEKSSNATATTSTTTAGTTSKTKTTATATPNLSVVKNNNDNNINLQQQQQQDSSDSDPPKDDVVIVTKIHGLAVNIEQLLQSLCLLKVAYNNQHNHNYDHIVFTTLPISTKNTLALQEIVKPANLTIILDSLPLHKGALSNLTKQQLMTLADNCNVTTINELKWDTPCHDGSDLSHYPPTSLRYNWQAEFRSRHLWFFKNLLKQYKYMIWYDSDAMATQIWNFDPIQIMKQNNLTILFERILNDLDGKNKTSIAGKEIQSIIHKSFPNYFDNNKVAAANNNKQVILCGIRLKDKHLSIMKYNCNSPKGSFRKVHGFFYIVDLEFYTSEEILNYFKIYYGDHKFIRYLDDQLAVTIPAALLRPKQSWDMSEHNIKFDILHNGYLDGQKFINIGKSKIQQPMTKFLDLIKQKNGTRVSKEMIDTCQHVITNNG